LPIFIELFLKSVLMAKLTNTDLKRGVVFEDKGTIYKVLKYSSVVRGRGSSIVKVKVREIKTGNVQEFTYRDNEKVESVDMKKRTVQFLYADKQRANFMNNETYEQFSLGKDVINDELQYLAEGEKVIALFLDGEPVSIEVPSVVELEVEYTEPAIKGDTATNAMKDAEMKNGLVVKVPLFIDKGDKLKINTDSGEYVSRV
jgi:elongation factor P